MWNENVNYSGKSLAGFSPFKGGIWRVVKKMVDNATNYGIDFAVYADNLYMVVKQEAGDFLWYSLDGSSMETSITVSDVVAENYRLLREYWGLSHDEIANFQSSVMHPSFIKYMMLVHPQLVAGAVGVLGRTTFKLKGMGSGVIGTFDFNTRKTTTLMVAALCMINAEGPAGVLANLLKSDQKHLYALDKIFKPVVEPKEDFATVTPGNSSPMKQLFNTIAGCVGVVMKVEAITRLPANYSEYWATSGPHHGDVTQVVRLDMLGFDMVVVSYPEMGLRGITCSILDRGRLERSIVFNKAQGELLHGHKAERFANYLVDPLRS
jgi:hypothetical protein